LQLAKSARTVYYDTDRNGGSLPRLAPILQTAVADGRVRPLRSLTHPLRWIKSPAEAALMRRSAELAAHAHRACMINSLPGVGEAQLAALFEFSCRMGGAQRVAYPSVVASGADACTIHYSR
jgi:Xaa-Pro aminopeptidase